MATLGRFQRAAASVALLLGDGGPVVVLGALHGGVGQLLGDAERVGALRIGQRPLEHAAYVGVQRDTHRAAGALGEVEGDGQPPGGYVEALPHLDEVRGAGGALLGGAVVAVPGGGRAAGLAGAIAGVVGRLLVAGLRALLLEPGVALHVERERTRRRRRPPARRLG